MPIKNTYFLSLYVCAVYSALHIGPLLISLTFPLWSLRNEQLTYVCCRISVSGNYLCKEQPTLPSGSVKIYEWYYASVNRLGILMEECLWLLLCCTMFRKHNTGKPELVKTAASVICMWRSWSIQEITHSCLSCKKKERNLMSWPLHFFWWWLIVRQHNDSVLCLKHREQWVWFYLKRSLTSVTSQLPSRTGLYLCAPC